MSLTNPNPSRRITCDKLNSELMSLKFDNFGLSVIKGAATILGIDMKSFFHPVQNYMYAHSVILANESIVIDPGNVSTSGRVTGIVIIADYPNEDQAGGILTENRKNLTFNYQGGPTMPMGKLMVLTGSDDNQWSLIGTPGELIINNPHSEFDVRLRILIIS